MEIKDVEDLNKFSVSCTFYAAERNIQILNRIQHFCNLVKVLIKVVFSDNKSDVFERNGYLEH